jgi:hypothetical protein
MALAAMAAVLVVAVAAIEAPGEGAGRAAAPGEEGMERVHGVS